MFPISANHDAKEPSDGSVFSVLLVVTDLQIGGTPLQVLRLADGLKRLGCNVRITALSGPGPIGDRLSQQGFDVFPLGARHVGNIGIIPALARLVAALKPDVCHSFLVHTNVLTRCVARFAPAPAIVSTICTAESQHQWHLMLENATWRLADAVVCVSDAVRTHMHTHAFIPSAAMRVIRPGIDVQRCLTAQPLRRDTLTTRPDRPLICSVGRLDPVKRIDLLIRAAASLVGRADPHVVIVGDGPERNRLENLVGQLRMTERVRFLGFRDNVAEILKSCDVHVLASQQEGWSISTTEALAVGTPVVVTAVAGPCEQVKDGQTGYIVPPGDVGALADGITAALKLPRQTGANEALTADVEQLSYMREAREYLNLYDELISSGQQRRSSCRNG